MPHDERLRKECQDFCAKMMEHYALSGLLILAAPTGENAISCWRGDHYSVYGQAKRYTTLQEAMWQREAADLLADETEQDED